MADLIDTILSNPAEWWSLFLGVVISVLVIYVTDDLVEAVLGTTVVVLLALWFLPVRITAEWHYWGGAIIAMLVLGLYEIGPKRPGR